MRTVYDAEGRSWRIWHVKPQSEVLLRTSPQLRQGWLCFESDADKRRLVEPPVDWERMADGELLALMARASEVARVVA